MDLMLAGRRVTVTDAELLGEGGEARVFRCGALALKIFHEVDPTQPAAVRARADKLRKLERLLRLARGLPDAVVAPQGLVTDDRGETLGYAMPLVDRAEPFSRLSSRRWRDGVLTNEGVLALHAALAQVLRALHAASVVVGDLNDGNVLFRDTRAFVIDADSLQLPGLPCVVGHERFLDPRLYGVDLAAAQGFDEGTDWYAFAVSLFASLLYVHPFGGTHATLGTLLRRAEARHSVLRPDVTLPRLAAPPRTLPDVALDYFERTFERDARQPPPDELLRLRWTRCTCGVEHARAVCPECHALGPLITRPVLRVRGRCTARTAFATSGRVLTAASQGGLRYVVDDGARVLREDGSVVLPASAPDAVRFAIAGRSTWVLRASGAAERIDAGRPVERASTALRHGAPVFAAGASVVYRQEREWLVEQGSGLRVGQVLDGQTWLWTGERLGLGFYRVGGRTVAFLVQVGRAGLRNLDGVAWAGRVVDAEAVFDAEHALLSVASEAGGVELVQRWLFDGRGQLLGRSSGGQRGRAALLAGRVLLGTDAGLLALRLDSGHLVEAASFPDTQPFVGAEDELLPQPDGSIYVVGTREILHLSLTQGATP